MKRTTGETMVNDQITDTTVQPAPEYVAKVDKLREEATKLIAERRFTEARKALEEADALEAAANEPETLRRRVLHAVRNPLSHLPRRRREADPREPIDRAEDIVSTHSKLAVVAGLVPGGLLNFGAILAVQVTMVWRIANAFEQFGGKGRIRGLILSLLGSAVPTLIGGGVMYNIVRIPAVLIGTVAGFVVTPVLAYAMTQAVGNTFVMHFESGGTLLTFDAEKFRDYFIKEFQAAGGTVAA